MTPALEVRGLWKGYVAGVQGCSARVSVLRGVSFSVAHGERVGIIGGPGAGKTTLLHCISGLRRPDTGFVRMIHYPAAPVLLLDDGWVMDAMNLRSPPRAALLFGRELQALTAYVDRVLLLRGGRVVAPESGHVGARRRVAEPGVCDDAPAFANR
ncbi:MAG: ATP-binding cassette domain-containing protein [Gemmatimonadaceae bacterium]|nr:ATP-binding cassette domain-containing protein [Gemmatimonadaceae bacterium]